MTISNISVPLPTTVFLQLANFLQQEGSNRDPVEVIENAIEYWIDNASWKKEDLMPETLENFDKGFQWKQLYLPHGTNLRMKYKGQFYYAKVNTDEIIYNDKSVSPGEFANSVANSSRNAWRDLEVKRPSDQGWHSAMVLRAEYNEEVERKGRDILDTL